MNPALATVHVHAGCFPEAEEAALLEALRTREVPARWLYANPAQVAAWRAIHRRYAPSAVEPAWVRAFDDAFATAAQRLGEATELSVIGLGCGDASKEIRLLGRLRSGGGFPAFLVVEGSLAMALTAAAAAAREAPQVETLPLVADLAGVGDLPATVDSLMGPAARIVTAFGLLPNLPGEVWLPGAAALLRPGDVLLGSANLLPPPGGRAAWEAILPQYDNPETRAWLGLFLRSLGILPEEGEWRWTAEPDPAKTAAGRIVARWIPGREIAIRLGAETLKWPAGEPVTLFRSWRHTPETLRALLARHGLEPERLWLAPGGDEALFLAGGRA
ncbi:MAG: hypothetical protein D6766_06950 [Verrucomicrobia bacterium]|nr:MAG: hypothetical protein D6766_06950 [Verrucomicrobiota bacterium]